VDEHYCAAIFRYLREYALHFRSESLLICLDDKHRMKCGKPGFPVAAAERGWRVIVSLNEEFQVGDHDFTRIQHNPKCHVSIDTIKGSWYSDQVRVKRGGVSTVLTNETWSRTELLAHYTTRKQVHSVPLH